MVAPPLFFAEIPWKILHFHGQKVGINNRRGNRVTKNKTRFWPDQKKANPMTRFSSNFSAVIGAEPYICYTSLNISLIFKIYFSSVRLQLRHGLAHSKQSPPSFARSIWAVLHRRLFRVLGSRIICRMSVNQKRAGPSFSSWYVQCNNYWSQ